MGEAAPSPAPLSRGRRLLGACLDLCVFKVSHPTSLKTTKWMRCVVVSLEMAVHKKPHLHLEPASVPDSLVRTGPAHNGHQAAIAIQATGGAVQTNARLSTSRQGLTR